MRGDLLLWLKGYWDSYIFGLVVFTVLTVALVKSIKSMIEGESKGPKVNAALLPFICFMMTIFLFFVLMKVLIPCTLDLKYALTKNYEIAEGNVYGKNISSVESGRTRGRRTIIEVSGKKIVFYYDGEDIVMMNKYRIEYLPNTKIGISYKAVCSE
jgi:hypothetical protein